MANFKRAWQSRSNLFTEGASTELPVFFLVRQQSVVTEGAQDNNEAASAVSWGSLLHVWEREYVERIYPTVLDEVRRPTDEGDGVSLERFHRTHPNYQEEPSTDLVDPMMLGVHTHGMLALLAAELGDTDTRDGLLRHADSVMRPTWKQGGLFYPCCDDLDTEHYMTCTMGNALLAAARINPQIGVYQLYNHPWTSAELMGPQVVGVEYPRVLITSASYDTDAGQLRVCLRPGDNPRTDAKFDVIHLGDKLPLEVCVDDSVLGRVDDAGIVHGEGARLGSAFAHAPRASRSAGQACHHRETRVMR